MCELNHLESMAIATCTYVEKACVTSIGGSVFICTTGRTGECSSVAHSYASGGKLLRTGV